MRMLFLLLLSAPPLFAQPPGGGPPKPGTVLPEFFQEELNLTAEQKKKLAEIQKSADTGFDKILTAKQKKDLAEFRPEPRERPEPRGDFPFPGGGPPKPKREFRVVEPTEANIRKAVEKSLPNLWAAMEGHNAVQTCFTCHNHGVSLVAMSIAKTRGYDIPEKRLAEQKEFLIDDLERNQKNFAKGRGPGPQPAGGETDNTGYLLFALEAVGHRPDEKTATVVSYTLGNQKGRAFWFTPAGRVPTEGSNFTTTALNIRGVSAFKTKNHAAVAEERIEAALGWLTDAKPKDTEDRVFQLIGLKAASAKADIVKSAAESLLKTQRDDGGWGQIDSLASDAYATGSALYALQTAGGITPNDAAWQKGIRFLLGTQATDGTWYVKSRSRPVQRYYESGFPYEKDQFISCAASGWATATLALATPVKK